MSLSDFLGADVRSAEGDIVGQLVDLAVQVGSADPVVSRMMIGRRRQARSMVGWDEVVSFEQGDIRLGTPRAELVTRTGTVLTERELLLRRDVLDSQIIDVAGKRLTRVSEVVLVRSGTRVQVAGVDVGRGGVWRRLGAHRLAAHAGEEVVSWADLHLTSTRGHALQLAISGRGVHTLSGPELAAVLAHLPTAKAAQVLDAVSTESAAAALSASHPRVAARLLPAVSQGRAASVVERMPVDDATAALRGLGSSAIDAVLGGVVSEREATLRRLLAHPADTAGGLMNTVVRTASVGESAEQIRHRVAAEVTELEGPATVFVLDDEGRPVGTYQPSDLLAGRATPRSVPSLPASLPIDRVIDLFALQDFLALPVVDDDSGRLVGAVAVDDVLEELLAERLPGHSHYGRVRRAARTLRRWRHRPPAGV